MITLFEKYFKFYNNGLPITYSAVVLDNESKNLLLSTYIYPNSEFSDWIKFADHLTICLGGLPEHLKRYWIDEEITLTVKEIGISDKAVAVKVDGFFTISKPNDLEEDGPKYQHVTLAINSIGAKPKDSNSITDWEKTDHLKLRGIVKEIQY